MPDDPSTFRPAARILERSAPISAPLRVLIEVRDDIPGLGDVMMEAMARRVESREGVSIWRLPDVFSHASAESLCDVLNDLAAHDETVTLIHADLQEALHQARIALE
jgi:hypothetical protein